VRGIRVRRGPVAWLLAACLGAPAAAGAATDWSGYASAGTDYIFRGVSMLDSGPALQASIEGRFGDRFVIGAWAANVDRQWLYQRDVPNHVELNLYAGVDLDCGPHCRARLLATGYEYPGPDAHAWLETTASVAFFERIGVSCSWSPHGFGTGSSTRTAEAWLVQPLSRRTSLAVDGGTVWIGSHPYWYARAGVSRRIDRWVVDLSHYWSDPKYVRYGLDDHRERFVLSASTAF